MRKRILQRWWPRIIVYDGDADEAWEAGWNGQNNGLRIRIWSGIAHFAAVLAQERYEWAFKWKVGLIPALFMRRRIEFHGHAVECVVAARWYGANLGAKLDAEARSLVGYRQFKGWTVAECRKGIEAAIPAAQKWVRKHEATIVSDIGWREGL